MTHPVIWTAISDTTAVAWTWPINPDSDHERRIIGTITYDTSPDHRTPYRRLASLTRAEVEQLPAWTQPPTPRQLRDYPGRLTVAAPPSTFATRQPGESTDTFYERVADTYLLLGKATGKPTIGLARLAGVTKPTAARWVREARRLGHLGPSKGRGRGGT